MREKIETKYKRGISFFPANPFFPSRIDELNQIMEKLEGCSWDFLERIGKMMSGFSTIRNPLTTEDGYNWIAMHFVINHHMLLIFFPRYKEEQGKVVSERSVAIYKDEGIDMPMVDRYMHALIGNLNEALNRARRPKKMYELSMT